MSTASQHASEGAAVPSDAAELAALVPAIPRLIQLLGGHPHSGAWDYDEHRIRLQHRPGAGISALYRMPAGTGFSELGLSTEKIDSPGTVSVRIAPPGPGLSIPINVSGWIHPFDPMLPALAIAMDGPSVAKYWADDQILTQLSPVAYRPLRRAVIRATFMTRGPLRIERNIFLKVGRPAASAALLTRQQIMSTSGIPVPKVLTPAGLESSLPGIIALEQAPGEGLSAILRRAATDESHLDVPDPSQFIAVLDALPRACMDLPARPAWSDGLHRYARAATLALPQHGLRITALLERIEHLLSISDRGELVPTHGDFYVANILLRGGEISALLDLDSLGPGYRVDDLACFLGHLAILPSLGEKNLAASTALEEYAEVFEQQGDPVALWARAGAVALTLVAGARTASDTWVSAAEARLRIAEELVGRAETLVKSP